MRVLVIGGTGFIGAPVVGRLVERGHHVTVVHRGEHEPPGPAAVPHIHADRSQLLDRITKLRAHAPDVVLDMTPMTQRMPKQR